MDEGKLELLIESTEGFPDLDKFEVAKVFLGPQAGEFLDCSSEELASRILGLEALRRVDSDFDFKSAKIEDKKHRIGFFRYSLIRQQEEEYGTSDLLFDALSIVRLWNLIKFFGPLHGKTKELDMVPGAFVGVPKCCFDKYPDWVGERSYLYEELDPYIRHVPCWAYCDRSMEMARQNKEIFEALGLEREIIPGGKLVVLYIDADFSLAERIYAEIGGYDLDNLPKDPTGIYLIDCYYVDQGKDRFDPKNKDALQKVVEKIMSIEGVKGVYCHAGVYPEPTEHNPREIPNDVNSINRAILMAH